MPLDDRCTAELPHEHTGRLLGEIRGGMQAIRDLLQQPTASRLNEVQPLLEGAIGRLHHLHEFLRRPDRLRNAALVDSALELQREVAQLSLWLEASAGISQRRISRLATQMGGYTPLGAPSRLTLQRRTLLEG